MLMGLRKTYSEDAVIFSGGGNMTGGTSTFSGSCILS